MRVAKKSELRQFYHERAIAYGRTFDDKSPYVVTILEDLAKFCCVHQTTYSKDIGAREMFILEGRRQVWLRLQEFMKLNADQLLEKYARPVNVDPQPKENEPK